MSMSEAPESSDTPSASPSPTPSASASPSPGASPSPSASPSPTPSLTGKESPLNAIEEEMLGFGVTNVQDLPPEVLARHGLNPDGTAM